MVRALQHTVVPLPYALSGKDWRSVFGVFPHLLDFRMLSTNYMACMVSLKDKANPSIQSVIVK